MAGEFDVSKGSLPRGTLEELITLGGGELASRARQMTHSRGKRKFVITDQQSMVR